MYLKCFVICHLTFIEHRLFVTYGLLVIKPFGFIRFFKDISMECQKVKNLRRQLNGSDVDLIHLEDIVLDYISEYC